MPVPCETAVSARGWCAHRRARTPAAGVNADRLRADKGGSQMELEALAEAVATRLKARAETIAVAESAAGGLISAALLAVPGASAYFLGSAVVYTRPARLALLA